MGGTVLLGWKPPGEGSKTASFLLQAIGRHFSTHHAAKCVDKNRSLTCCNIFVVLLHGAIVVARIGRTLHQGKLVDVAVGAKLTPGQRRCILILWKPVQNIYRISRLESNRRRRTKRKDIYGYPSWLWLTVAEFPRLRI